jgi:hypothetical protein
VAEDADRDLREGGARRDGYERLRAAVLSGSASGWRLGHGVLSARGMVGWMSTFSELAPPAPADTRAAVPATVTPLPAATADQVVAVLAQMTLAIAA